MEPGEREQKRQVYVSVEAIVDAIQLAVNFVTGEADTHLIKLQWNGT